MKISLRLRRVLSPISLRSSEQPSTTQADRANTQVSVESQYTVRVPTKPSPLSIQQMANEAEGSAALKSPATTALSSDTQRYASQFTHEPTVLLLVGKSRKEFYVHRKLLCEQSPYFQARLKECWDGVEGPVELDDIDAVGFEAAVEWMYSKSLLPQYLDFTGTDETFNSGHIRMAYKVGDRLLMTDFQNKLMDQIALLYTKYNATSCMKTLARTGGVEELQHTPYYRFMVKSAARKFMLERESTNYDWETAISMVSHKPQVVNDILHEIMKWNVRSWSSSCGEDPCDFHIHTDDRRCPKPQDLVALS